MTGARPDVLLIDDSLVDLRLLMELMTLRDLRFAVGREAERGYEQAVVLQPALILLDVTCRVWTASRCAVASRPTP